MHAHDASILRGASRKGQSMKSPSLALLSSPLACPAQPTRSPCHASVADGRRWKDARGCVAWVLCKLEAAEKLWTTTAKPVDFALTMGSEDDEQFFMTPGAQE